MDGKGCTCAAWSESECGCVDVDWTDSNTVKAARKQALLDFADMFERGTSGWTPKTIRELAESEEFQNGFESK